MQDKNTVREQPLWSFRHAHQGDVLRFTAAPEKSKSCLTSNNGTTYTVNPDSRKVCGLLGMCKNYFENKKKSLTYKF